MRQSILLFLAAATTVNAQFVSFGVKGGVPLSEAIPNRLFCCFDTLNTGRWTVGPTVEFRLPFRFSFEVDALFRGYRLEGNGPAFLGPNLSPLLISNRQDVKAWDLPFLLKYRILNGSTRPFLNAGMSVTRQSTDYSGTGVCLGPLSCYPPDSPNPVLNASKFTLSQNRRGIVAGAGVEFKYGRARISPEFRYTRLQNLGTHQAAILFGLTF
jgi:hypothetical protein